MTDSHFATHTVTNQSPPKAGHNAYLGDPLLCMLTAGLAQETQQGLVAHGAWAGVGEVQELARLANLYTPVLKTHDAKGTRVDLVEYHPAYHALMRKSVSIGLHASVWEEVNNEHGVRNLARAARFYLSAGVETGHLCPITMTNASVAALHAAPQVLGQWLEPIRSRNYDSSQRPPAAKSGLTIGMGMTEKQGGTDVRANTTTAEPDGNGMWRLVGHKWFMSAPMCDGFLVLAQTGEGLSCFLMPRILPDGSRNALSFVRLKDKLGNRSNASSEVEFQGALAHMIGEPGKGVRTILEMVTLTRLDCAVASSGIMRAALGDAVHHARHREVFGRKLIDQPLMTRVLADMALEVEATTALSLRLATSFDRAASDPAEQAWARLMTPVVKYWTCKIAPAFVYEAMECLGGNGYIDDGALSRHYREAPVNAIWEGSGNVMCLDVLRVMSRGPELLQIVLNDLSTSLGHTTTKLVDVIRTAAEMALQDEGSARILVEQLALTAAAAELRKVRGGEIADAFIETRLGGLWRNTYGMLDNRYNAAGLIEASFPAQQ